MTQNNQTLLDEKKIPDGYKKTEIGLIPQDWAVQKLGELFEPSITRMKLKSDDSVAFVGMQDVSESAQLITQKVVKFHEVKSGFTFFGKGDVLVAKITPCFENGKGCIADNLITDVGFGSTEFHVLRANQNSVSKFIYYWTVNSTFRKKLELDMVGSAGHRRVPLSSIQNYLIPLPTTQAEQQKIATALSDTDALISELEKLIEKKQAIKTAIMQQLLTGKTRLPEFALYEDGTPKGYKDSELGQIPEDWELSEIYELADRQKAKFDDGDWIEAEHITNKGVRLIQTGNIGIGSFLDKESKKYIYEESFTTLKCKELKMNDILICRLAEPAGRACIFEGLDDEKVITSVDVTIFRPIESNVSRVFLNQFFTSDVWFSQVKEHVGGTTHKRISRGALGKLKVVTPALDEQTEIAKILHAMNLDLAELKKNHIKYMNIKQGMMQELLTGKTRLV